MSYVRLDEFRGGQSRRGFPVLIVLSGFLLIMSAVIIATELVTYSDVYDDVNETFGDDVTIGGVQVGGLNEADRLAVLESVYTEQPILLRYEGSPIEVIPRDIGFELNTSAMQASATAQVEGDFWAGFWDYLWRDDQRAISVPLEAQYDRAALRNYLEELALRYDSESRAPGFNTQTGTFQGSGRNTQLDIEAAIPLIERALYEPDPQQRVIELPIVTTEGQAPQMEDLRQAIIDYLVADGRLFYDGPESAVSLFVLNLETGEEISIQKNLLHDATSIIKIGILINYFRHTITEPSPDVKYMLLNAVACSDNGSANDLMLLTSEDRTFRDGILKTNDTLCEAGAVNSKITTNLDIGSAENLPAGYYTVFGVPACPGQGVTSATPDPSINTQPSPQLQTTADDIGTLLMNIYDCAVHGSGLRTLFPEEITQTECQWIMNLLRGTHFIHLMELGVPPTADLAHKVGYADDTFGDAGIVQSPGGDYIFVMLVWEPDSDRNGLTDIRKWSMIGDVNRIVYNYFNPDQPLPQTREPYSPTTGAGCVMPRPGYEVNLNDINENRYDENMVPIPNVACVEPPNCVEWRGN
ncbi:MAG: hypothetical protein GYB66_03200 [Chloroflexi bacterium]|nr:hypothetical protein [Chloroflexota bacterium]